MTRVHEVELEILRQGPPHNQLLSPLTPYIALAEGREPTTVHVPYEHRTLLDDLALLRYRPSGGGSSTTGSGNRTLELGLIAERVGQLLESVPGLLAGLSENRCDEEELIHLRLIFSAEELSLVPFEMATSPSGFPGEGQPLSLQLESPVVMTREVRSARGGRLPWPTRPRVLFVAASPIGFSSVPKTAHLQALVNALEPWLGPEIEHDWGESVDVRSQQLGRYLTFLDNASLWDIEQACRGQRFTHVHILAHGARLDDEGLGRFALALQQRGSTEVDLVSPERLAAALRTSRTGEPEFSQPNVVTLATCDSGNQAQVIVPASSLGHTLHEAGIPFVVASQFPLTKRGSVLLTQTLYDGLLSARDPRWVLLEARRRLRALEQRTHDWASVVAFASLPDGLEEQLLDCQYRVARRGVQNANRLTSRLIRAVSDEVGQDWADRHPFDEERKEVFASIIGLADRSAEAIPCTGKYELEGRGMVATKEKQKAQSYYLVSKLVKGRERDAMLARSLDALLEARRQYAEASGVSRLRIGALSWTPADLQWVLTQWQSLDAALDGDPDLAAWNAARFAAQLCSSSSEGEDRLWGNASLMELDLIALAHPRERRMRDDESLRCSALERVQKVIEHTSPGSFAIDSLVIQLRRYSDWWASEDFVAALKKRRIERAVDWQAPGGVAETATELRDLLLAY